MELFAFRSYLSEGQLHIKIINEISEIYWVTHFVVSKVNVNKTRISFNVDIMRELHYII